MQNNNNNNCLIHTISLVNLSFVLLAVVSIVAITITQEIGLQKNTCYHTNIK